MPREKETEEEKGEKWAPEGDLSSKTAQTHVEHQKIIEIWRFIRAVPPDIAERERDR